MDIRWLCTFAILALPASVLAQSSGGTPVFPITGPVRDAGIYDIQTGRFLRRSGSQPAAATSVIYNNTCIWTGGSFYVGTGQCDDLYDEGRVPSSVPCPNANTSTCYEVDQFDVSYCTGAVTGTVDIDIELFDTVNGGGTACTQLSGGLNNAGSGILFFDSSAAGFPLPGASLSGSVACWQLTFSYAPGIPVHAGATSNDLFTWRFRSNNDSVSSGGAVNGPLIAGNPGANPYDGIFTCGGTCGTGLDNADAFWINVDNTAAGGTPPPSCVGSPPLGTNCYFFGGYPTNPFAGVYLDLLSDKPCTCTGSVADYCTAKVNSLGCTPVLSATGIPKLGFSSGFTIEALQLIGKKSALFFYSTHGLNGVPFQGGFLCVKPPIVRLAIANTGGASNKCDGVLATDFNARIASGADPALVAGTLVGIQAWSRDPASPSTTSLSAGKSFTICP